MSKTAVKTSKDTHKSAAELGTPRGQCAGWPACSTATGQQMHAYAPHAKSFSSQSKNLVKGLGQAHSTARAEQTETYTQHI